MTQRALIILAVSLVTVPLLAEGSGSRRRSASGRAQKKFERVAREVYSDLVRQMDEKTRHEAMRALACTEEQLPEKLAGMLMQTSRNLFVLSEKEAREVLSGKFDNYGNRAKVRIAKKVLTATGITLPLLTTVLIDQFDSGQLHGLKLEFAARVLSHQAEQVKQALGGRSKR